VLKALCFARLSRHSNARIIQAIFDHDEENQI